MKAKWSQVEDEIKVCPYCMDQIKRQFSCCGEVHFENAYVINGEYYLASEVELEDDEQTETVEG